MREWMEKRRETMRGKLGIGLAVVLCAFSGCGSDNPSGSEDQNEVTAPISNEVSSTPDRESNPSEIGAFVGTWKGDMDVYIDGKRENESEVAIGFYADGNWVGVQAVPFFGSVYLYDLVGNYTAAGSTISGKGNSKLESAPNFDSSENMSFRLTLSADKMILSGSWSDGTEVEYKNFKISKQ